MNILYMEPKNKGLYYEEFSRCLKEKASVYQYGPGVDLYDRDHSIEDILNLYTQETKIPQPDLILFGFGWENDAHPTEYNFHKNLNLSNINIKKAVILNKEYKKMQSRMSFVKENKIDLCFTALHIAEDISKIIKKPVYRMPFAANKNIFKNYKQEKALDLGFSGNLFNKGVYKETNIMGSYFQNIRERVYEELKKDDYQKLKILWNSEHHKNVFGVEYSKLINSSKIWLNTPSAIQIVGTRYFEVIASNSLLFCRECDLAYDGLGFVDGETCVTFNSELTNFKDKLFYYLKNDSERNKIIKNAHNLFINNHTWEHRVYFLLETASSHNK